jgi:UDP-N-acetyl-D-galactosamine dehydrogenase
MKICIVGLGYVGLPLATLFAKKFKVIGFDIDSKRIEELKQGLDKTREVNKKELENKNLVFSVNESVISECDVVIITVPTPVNKYKEPDLSCIKKATEITGRNLKKGAVVVYESTVWPGFTEEICVPILEKVSGFKWKKDFFVGYSPERINPGDKKHTIEKIVKVVAGDTKETAKFLADLYRTVIPAGVYIAPSIKIAEAAKMVENIQRDVNIAFMNELALIFHRLGIDTKEVLKASKTKWNFLEFEPGLVGGHCIGVDPYYFIYKAKEVGCIPQLILTGRFINESLPRFIAEEIIKLLVKTGKVVNRSKALILGFTFKEDVPDVRNTKVYDLVQILEEFGVKSVIYDPIADREKTEKEYSIKLVEDFRKLSPYDVVIVAVKHKLFQRKLDLSVIKQLCKEPAILVDIKGVYDREEAIKKQVIYWRL